MYSKVALKYANDVIKNKIPSNVYVKKSAQRFLDDIKGDYYIDEERLDYVINFIQEFYLTEETEKIKTKLQPFQVFLIANIRGLYHKEKKTLKYRTIYIEIPRGNAKTQLISFLCILELLTGNDAQVVYAANTTKQAMEVGFDKIKKLVHQIDPKEKYIKVYYNKIIYKNNKLIITSNESKPIDGLSGSLMCIDEYHEFSNTRTYDVLKSSMVKRTDNQLFIITTAGFNTESECYKMRNYCIDILDGKYKDDSQFAMIYTIDSDDDYTDSKCWKKANPMLGISVNENVISQEVIKAQQNVSERPSILVKHFNIWLKSNSELLYLDNETINSCSQKINMEEFKGGDVYIGIDLSSVDDITAVSYLVVKGDKYYFFNRYYLCEETVEKSVNRDIYKRAILLGDIKITSGNVVDYDYILNDLITIRDNYNIVKITYDKWNSTQFVINATNEGMNLEEFSQTAGNLNRPLKELERLSKSGNVIIEDNSLTKWMFDNVVLDLDKYGNYKIDKSVRSRKIDGVAAMINALGAYLQMNVFVAEVF